MSDTPNRPQRGVPIPAVGTCIAIAAAICAAWAIWSQFRTPAPEPVILPETNRPMSRIQNVEALVLEGRDGVPELVAMLGDPDPRTRRDALFGLGQLGPEAADEIERVRARLSDENADVRSTALSAFWRINREPEIFVAAIGPLLADADEKVRKNATETLIAGWRREYQMFRNAGDRNGQGTPDLDTTAALMALLKSEIPGVRSGSLWVLRQLYVQTPAVEAAARDLLDDSDAEVRDQALSLLIALDMASIAELRAGLQREFPFEQGEYPAAGAARWSPVGPYDDWRHRALGAIIRRGPAAAELVPDLSMVLDRLQVLEQKHEPGPSSGRAADFDLDSHVGGILGALRAMKGEAPSAVPHLLRRIDELHDFGRIQFAQTLAEIGAEHEAISEILVAIISDERPVNPADRNAWEARRLNLLAAGKLLVQVDPQEARRQVSLAIPRLGGDKKPINKTVLSLLLGLAPEAQEASRHIEALVKYPEQDVCWTATEILKQLRK